ncbi:unnamed protein product [Mytilus coruscus]|uniref:Endonuclease/exonuclease/phosphatase domain-containing protein n=1 Tax=Mytilus coruscus TaxID=42192 RepID=A0A6J8AMT3_MYTCO|nr:unnamed protein product [Mytilus coruscus]
MTFNNTKEVITKTACNLGKSKTQLDENDYTNNIYGHQKTKGLKVTFQNIQHLLPKLDEIKYNFRKMKDWEKPHVLGMCETFLTPEKCHDKSKELEISGFTFERKDRKTSKGGGWINYFSDSIKYTRRCEFESENIESMWFELFPKHCKSFLLSFIYRPPNSMTSWYDFFENEIEKAYSYNNHIVLTGDFNIDFLQPLHKKWDCILSVYNIFQLVNEPTRVTKNRVTLIDHIYSTNPEEITDVNVPAYCPGDHYPVSFTIKKPIFKTSVDKHVTIKYRNFTKFNKEKFIEDLKAKNFNEILYFDNPDHALDAWYSKLLNVLNKHAPIITKRVKKKSQPKWLNQDINQLRAIRDFYHKKRDFENYKLFKNKLTAQINKCKTDYFSKAVQSNSKTSEIWKHLKDLNAESKCPITSVTFQGSDVNEPKKVCEHFNEHFGTVAESVILTPNQISNPQS